MKKLMITTLGFIVASSFSAAFAANYQRGEQLFNNPGLGGGTSGKSCKSCHDGGEGLKKSLFDQKEFGADGKENATLADLVNICIEKAMKGNKIDAKDQDMDDLMAYMKILVGNAKKEEKPTKKKPDGC